METSCPACAADVATEAVWVMLDGLWVWVPDYDVAPRDANR